MITGYPIDGAMVSSDEGLVWKLSVVCLHNNAIVASGILVTILHYGTPNPHLSAIYIVSSVGTSLYSIRSMNGSQIFFTISYNRRKRIVKTKLGS